MQNFVYAKKAIKHENGTVKKNEIGIVEKMLEKTAVVSFARDGVKLEIDHSIIKNFDPEKTGDQYDKKVCNVCCRILKVSLFQKNQNGKNNRTVRRPSCNECRTIINGKSMTSKEKKQMNEIKPNMEIWTCPICQKTTIPGLTSKVVCDHNHETGHPRAWICDSCNTGLGRFKDDIELLNSAIEYLKNKK